MKFRDLTLFSGHAFRVPQCIQRIDTRATHGWQLRYGGTKMFSDHSNDGSGAAAALILATKELQRRIATLEAPTLLQPRPNVNKTSNLPVGISGPVIRLRRGSNVRTASLLVLQPIYGHKPRHRSVYIGTENTYTRVKYETAVAKAVALRTEAEERYRREETRIKRADGRALRLSSLIINNAPHAFAA